MPLVTRNLPKKNAVLFLARAAQRQRGGQREGGLVVLAAAIVDTRTGSLHKRIGAEIVCVRRRRVRVLAREREIEAIL